MKTIIQNIVASSCFAYFTMFAAEAVLLSLGQPRSLVFALASIVCDVTFLMYYLQLKRIKPHIGLFPFGFKQSARFSATSLFLTALCYLFAVILISLVHGRAHFAPNFDVTRVIAIIFIVLAASGEEILFRSYLLILALRRFRIVPAILLNSLGFTALHLPYVLSSPLEFVAQFSLSMLLCVVVLISRSLLPSIAIHAALNYANGLQRLAKEAPLDHPGIFVFENGAPNDMFLAIQTLVSIAAVVLLFRRLNPSESRFELHRLSEADLAKK